MSKWGHLGATFENQLTRRQKTKLNDDVDDNAAPSDDDVADDDDEEDSNKNESQTACCALRPQSSPGLWLTL